jgi:hypothetical protein
MGGERRNSLKILIISGALWIAVFCGMSFGLLSCGDDAGGCPGKVCTNCGASGDCNIECTGDKVQFCGHFGYFDDPNLRCTFCEDPNFQP